MALRIEDYAVVGDTRTAALVGRDGSVDWMCVPRFDGGACFAALLGTPEHGRWLIAPADRDARVSRRYRDGTMVLETTFTTSAGVVRVVDHMPLDGDGPRLVRIVEGVSGTVPMRAELVVRFDHGSVVPWVRRHGDTRIFVGGPDALWLRSPVDLHGAGLTSVAAFGVSAGDRVPFTLSWGPSHLPPPPATDPFAALRATESWWREWSASASRESPWGELALRSLLTLKAMTYAPTGGIVAAVTTSLPERIGGSRNWDYRFCWLRDATFMLYALMLGGFTGEARAWRDWLLRAVAGDPARLQIMYGASGERRLTERTLGWLPGYEGSRPVREGNAASDQFQLDVYGEVMDSLHVARRVGIEADGDAWGLQRALMDFLEGAWVLPDEGIWEVRGPRRHFTHSKVMAWVAFDRAVAAVERFGHEGPVDRWRALREQVRRDVLDHGFDADLGAFVQSYGSTELDASLLMIPLVGFLPADDPRMTGTVAAIRERLTVDGFVMRYGPGARGEVDGIDEGEGAFLPCSFWLVDNLAMAGRTAEAAELFGTLAGVANDVGLYAEEFDPRTGRMVGNFPQAFTHLSLVNSVHNLAGTAGPARHRGQARAAPGEAPAVGISSLRPRARRGP